MEKIANTPIINHEKRRVLAMPKIIAKTYLNPGITTFSNKKNPKLQKTNIVTNNNKDKKSDPKLFCSKKIFITTKSILKSTIMSETNEI